jgi:hypothetical protein
MPNTRDIMERLDKFIAGVQTKVNTRPVQTKGRQKTEEEWKLAIYEACLAPLNEEDRTKFYDFLEEMAKGLK